MGAVYGVVGNDTPQSLRTQTELLGQRLEHRGPRASMFAFGPVCIAHCGADPLVASVGGVTLVGDIRLDERPPSGPDADEAEPTVVARLADALGANVAAASLCGDFAMAVFDQTTQRTTLIRDHFGVRPLYYARRGDGNVVAFASEPKALLALDWVDDDINSATVLATLENKVVDARATFFRAIHIVPAAHSLIIHPDGSVLLQRYWSLDPDGPSARAGDELVDRFRQRFIASVRTRLQGDGVGSQISGGLDSSSITAVARQLLPAGTQLHTYTGVFDVVASCDERQYAQSLLATGEYTPHFVVADEVGPLQTARRLAAIVDGPVTHGNISLNDRMYTAARSDGVSVLLDGFDGDTTVSHGEGRLKQLAYSGRLVRLWRECRGASITLGQSTRSLFLSYVKFWTLRTRFTASAPGAALWRTAARLRRKPRPVDPHPVAPGDVFAPGRAWVTPATQYPRRPQLDARSSERAVHTARLGNNGFPYTLEVLDMLSAHHGIELRFPFWDRRLIETCVSLPPVAKLDKGWTRAVLRKAMAGFLPDDLRWRRDKSDLGPGYVRGLLELDRDLLRSTLADDASPLAQYVQLDVARAMIERQIARYDRHGATGVDHGACVQIGQIAAVGIWLASRSSSGRDQATDTTR